MNISYNWLKGYINHGLNPSELAKVLTNIGLEVESFESVSENDNLNGFVVGEIKTCKRHPDADNLFVTTVDTGLPEPLSIVCGAPNVQAGQHVVVATVGTTINKGDKSFRIKKVKIRGIVSEGMICAEDEIGSGSRHEEIMILPGDVPVGLPLESYINPEPDTRLSIDLTPNRIDSASHFGVARDLAAFLRTNKDVTLNKPDISSFKEGDGSYKVAVSIENEVACRRYAGICLSGVQVGPSPQWLQDKLKTIGLNPINNVVDITNFVLFELGQPLHAFDADTLKGRKIIVKNLPAGTKFTTLDGIEHLLSKEDLMICDAENPIAIAGVFGGVYSGVTDTTRNIFIESAYFDPVSVRRTSKRLGINTDASFRFERGVDPEITIFALKRCALMIEEITGGSISSAITDVHPNPIVPKQVQIRYDNAEKLIGKKIETSVIQSILSALEFDIISEDDQGLILKVPPYRVDVEREADIIEEILRIYGYNNVEMSDKLRTSLSYTSKPDQENLFTVISDYLCSNGFYEIMCNSLTRSAYYDHLTSLKPGNLVRLMNPLSKDLNVMRQSLIFGGLETIIRNINRQRPDLKIFEFGTCYSLIPGQKHGINPLDKYREDFRLSLFLTGKGSPSEWMSEKESMSYYLLKTYLENIMELMGIAPDTLQTDNILDKKDLYATGIVYQTKKKQIAELAIINSSLLKQFDIEQDVFYAEVIWSNLLGLIHDHHIRHQELPKFPEVRRDLSLLLDQSVTYSRIKGLAFKAEQKLIKRIRLFDVYQGENIEKGKKSYAVSFILQDPERTLTDERIDRIMKKLMDTYIKELGALIR